MLMNAFSADKKMALDTVFLVFSRNFLIDGLFGSYGMMGG